MSSCSAASRREDPPSTRAITHMRMSAEYAFGMARPPDESMPPDSPIYRSLGILRFYSARTCSSLLSVVALKCRAHFIAEHICASQQNSLDPDCWDLCNLVGFGPRAAVPSQRAECACTALIRLAQWFAHLQHHIWIFSNQ